MLFFYLLNYFFLCNLFLNLSGSLLVIRSLGCEFSDFDKTGTLLLFLFLLFFFFFFFHWELLKGPIEIKWNELGKYNLLFFFFALSCFLCMSGMAGKNVFLIVIKIGRNRIKKIDKKRCDENQCEINWNFLLWKWLRSCNKESFQIQNKN